MRNNYYIYGMKTIKTVLFALCVLCAAGCAQAKDEAPKYANRAEAIAAQMHDPSSKYVVVACHRGDWRNFPENSAMAIDLVPRKATGAALGIVGMTSPT